MPACKITVLKKLFNEDLADEYRRPEIHRGPCPHFTEGQEFVVEEIGERPEGFFCGWAWDDIQRLVLAMMVGGDFSQWMNDSNTFVACCTDGIKPVVFRLERVQE
ncbi:MAG: TIGR04076 family protein [Anaerolineae bacterium]